MMGNPNQPFRAMSTVPKNTLIFGDNLRWLRDTTVFPDESVDLIYLDPPFNSQRGYNVLFKEVDGAPSASQIRAFDDTWQWDADARDRLKEIEDTAPGRVTAVVRALEIMLGHSAMFAYLVQMAARLVHLHRVLKKTGSLYLHCDPTASHYLKVLLDAIFDQRNFRNEIIWKRTTAHSDVAQGAKRAGRIHDVILSYARSDAATYNVQYTPYSDEYLDQFYRHVDAQSGRRYALDNLTAAKPGGDVSYEWRIKRPVGGAWIGDLSGEYTNPKPGWEYLGVFPYRNRFWAYSRDNMERLESEGLIAYSRTGSPRYKRFLSDKGVPLQDIWTDLPPVAGHERLGYPTQKPLALLQRIIRTSSNPGDVVLDPFCGCGTTIDAVETINRENPHEARRRWIGIDLTHLAITLIKNRLARFTPPARFAVMGEPADVSAAGFLAQRDRYQFQYWALGLIGAVPWGGEKKKGADKGIDGVRYFRDERSGPGKMLLVQVKSGHVKVGDIRDLRGTMEREKAAMSVFLTLEEPSREMRLEALDAGEYYSPGPQRGYPRIQILTVAELLTDPDGPPSPRCLSMPPTFAGDTIRQAPSHVSRPAQEQGEFL